MSPREQAKSWAVRLMVGPLSPVEALEGAIEEERSRCAKIAESFSEGGWKGVPGARNKISDAILKD